MKRLRVGIAALVAAMFFVTACGGGNEASPSSEAGTEEQEVSTSSCNPDTSPGALNRFKASYYGDLWVYRYIKFASREGDILYLAVRPDLDRVGASDEPMPDPSDPNFGQKLLSMNVENHDDAANSELSGFVINGKTYFPCK